MTLKKKSALRITILLSLILLVVGIFYLPQAIAWTAIKSNPGAYIVRLNKCDEYLCATVAVEGKGTFETYGIPNALNFWHTSGPNNWFGVTDINGYNIARDRCLHRFRNVKEVIEKYDEILKSAKDCQK